MWGVIDMTQYNEENGFMSELSDLLDKQEFALDITGAANGKYFAELTNYNVNHMEWTEKLVIDKPTIRDLTRALETRVLEFDPNDEAVNYYDEDISVKGKPYTMKQCIEDMQQEEIELLHFFEGLEKIPDGYLTKELALSHAAEIGIER